MIAYVVPILRLRRATTWWSYKVPSGIHCEPGSLVSIPFRGHMCAGVVWEVHTHDEQAEESIARVLYKFPLLHAPHRRFVEYLSEAGLLSLSTALYIWLPTALRKFPFTPTTQKILAKAEQTSLTAIEMAERKQQLVLLPSRRAESTLALEKKYMGKVIELFDTTNPHQELEHWFSIAQGEKTIIIGRERATTAPFLNLRHVLIQEPEDIAYFHEQLPYISYQEATQKLAEIFQAQITIKSHIPQEAAQLLWGNHTLGSTAVAQPTIIDLSRSDILHENLIEALRNLNPAQKALLLYNAHDRFVDTPDNQKKLLPGIESLRKKLAFQLGHSTLPRNIILDTRAMFSSLHSNVGFTAILSLDPLLHTQSFADVVHGWSDIGRLLSYNAPCYIQTRNQDHPLIHALRNNGFAEYCVGEIKKREMHHLPPFATTIVCSYPDQEESTVEVQKIHEKITKLLQKTNSNWHISHPFPELRRKKAFHHILIYSSEQDHLPSPVASLLTSLSRPWKVQRNPWFVL